MIPNDTFFMDLAIREAWKYQMITYPNPAVGAVVVENGRIVSIEAHQRAGGSHAEIRALLSAYEKKSGEEIDFDKNSAFLGHKFLLSIPKDFFRHCEIFITLEPCSHRGKTPSCANLLSKLKLKRVVIATNEPVESHSGGIKVLKDKGTKIDIGIEQKRAKELLEPFIIWQNRKFILFKLAQSLNGRIGGGYLSSKESLTHTHKIREVVDKLVIGGNTVRVDRPTLDCRFSRLSKAPDVSILSKQKKFDKTIPLFNVKGRRVEIVESLDFSGTGLILVEGGEGTLKALEAKIDWFLIYLTPKLTDNEMSYQLNRNLKFLYKDSMGKDYILWSKFE